MSVSHPTADGAGHPGVWRYVEAQDAGAALPRRLAAVWRHQRLLRRMAERDLRQRYVGSTLGFAWAAVHPLLFVAAYAFVFTFVFRGRLSPDSPAEQYMLYVVTGLLPWVALSEVASKAAQTMAEHRQLVKYVVFPVHILPLTSLYATAFSQLVGLSAVLVLTLWLRGGPDASLLSLLLLVPIVVLQIAFLAGIAWLLGAIGAVWRDVKELVQVVLTWGMFLTPIFYLERDLPAGLRPLVAVNPMAHLVGLYRDAFQGAGLQHPASLVVFGAVAVAVLLAGFLVFERVRVFLSDIL
jgi:lipopolysaccharide transport system permease protein